MRTGTDTLVVEANLEEFARIVEWAGSWTARMHLPASTSFAVQLCFEEAVSNIVRHGFPGTPTEAGVNKEVRLAVWRQDDAVVARIDDFGAAFDPRQVASPAAPSSIHEAPVGGQGIHLMRRFAQHMDYERRGDMNRLTLRFDLSSDVT